MLVLSRKKQESIVIDAQVTITVLRIKGSQVQIGIEAPREVHVVRGELKQREAAAPNRHDSASAQSANPAPPADGPPPSRHARPLGQILQAMHDGEAILAST